MNPYKRNPLEIMKYSKYLVSAAASILAITGIASVAFASDKVVSFSSDAMNVSCPILTTFMRQGIPNSKAEVTRLQQFLKDSENLTVDVNGTYDQKTEDAVKAFQKKYADTILTPWGATRASGIVYITTEKKINQLACDEAMTLDEKELATIAHYKPGLAMASNNVSKADEGEPTVMYPTNPDDANDNSNMTAAAGSSMIGKFWYFLKNLF